MARRTADGDPRLRLVYEESLRAIEDQQRSLDNLRSRAGQLLTAASVVQTFLVGLVLRAEGAPHAATWVGAGAFVLLALVCVWIVLPRRGWTFAEQRHDPARRVCRRRPARVTR